MSHHLIQQYLNELSDLRRASGTTREGVVSEASVDSTKSTINEPGVGTCITDIIKKVKFAPSKLGFETRAAYPFNFHPKTYGKADAGGAK